MDEGTRKKMAHAIVIGIGKPEPESEAGQPSGPDEGLVAAMEEFHAAFEKKDFAGMAEAFESAASICENYEPEEDVKASA